MDNYFASSKTVEFIQTIMERENLHTPKMVYVKSKARADRGGGTWMHPLLFIDFAMWINPSFKYDVLKFVYDKMLDYRNEAGEAYKELGKAMSNICSKSFMPAAMCNVAKALNYIVFGVHERETRNKQGEEDKQYELFNMERQVAMLVNDGFLCSYDQVIEYLRRKYTDKYLPSVLRRRPRA